MIDDQFNTTDVAIVVKTDLVTGKYIDHYKRTDLTMARFNVVMTAPRLAAPAVAVLEQAGCPSTTCRPIPAPRPSPSAARPRPTRCCPARARSRRRRWTPRPGCASSPGTASGWTTWTWRPPPPAASLVTRAPGSNTPAVAEHTMAMILALAKQLRPLGAALAAGGWREGAPPVRDVAGLRLGLVGFGAIGQAVGRLAAAFGMEVGDHRAAAGRHAPLAELLPRSDVLSLHCPYTPATHHLIDAAALAALPAGASWSTPRAAA